MNNVHTEQRSVSLCWAINQYKTNRHFRMIELNCSIVDMIAVLVIVAVTFVGLSVCLTIICCGVYCLRRFDFLVLHYFVVEIKVDGKIELCRDCHNGA